MKAMLLTELQPVAPGEGPLVRADLPVPTPGPGEILLQLSCCGVCHTELDEIEGRTPPPSLPVIPGHQAVGRVTQRGQGAEKYALGDRLGVAWIYRSCLRCEHCLAGNENLCSEFVATGRDAHGGYAEYMVVPEAFAHPIPDILTDFQAAPLLCAGAIGWRSLRLTGIADGQCLGLTGFGASGHLVLKLTKHLFPQTFIAVFARNPAEREFAMEIGADWAGGTEDSPPELLHAIIDTTPVWRPVLAALRCLRPGGRLVINAIRKESSDRDLLAGLSYETDLWMEKEIKSVANVARRDVTEFVELAGKLPDLRPEVQTYPLQAANSALQDLKARHIRGAKVLDIRAG